MPRVSAPPSGPRPALQTVAISSAALLVKVTARIRRGAKPNVSMRCLMRSMRHKVFPAPGPARTSTGPNGASMAFRCCRVGSKITAPGPGPGIAPSSTSVSTSSSRTASAVRPDSLSMPKEWSPPSIRCSVARLPESLDSREQKIGLGEWYPGPLEEKHRQTTRIEVIGAIGTGRARRMKGKTQEGQTPHSGNEVAAAPDVIRPPKDSPGDERKLGGRLGGPTRRRAHSGLGHGREDPAGGHPLPYKETRSEGWPRRGGERRRDGVQKRCRMPAPAPCART